MKDLRFRKGYKYGFDNLVARGRLLGAQKSTLLTEDVLTLQCCIFPKNTELGFYTEVIARTRTGFERYRCQWKAIDYAGDNYISLNWEEDGENRLLRCVSSESNEQPDVLACEFG
ncbi:hypothetical protein AVEN_197625-1 [Araneus ventricosus]|uniref:Uncharacterized protein n=1 Tax=Araneus ventricosus TaxID=182803 RepID=A0A4Y2LUP3_ARAVE|nr:hypothetical protein AVEN_197625-1 [Araneus ventricosus]